MFEFRFSFGFRIGSGCGIGSRGGIMGNQVLNLRLKHYFYIDHFMELSWQRIPFLGSIIGKTFLILFCTRFLKFE